MDEIDGVPCRNGTVRITNWLKSKGYGQRSLDKLIKSLRKGRYTDEQIEQEIEDIREEFTNWATAHGLIWMEDW